MSDLINRQDAIDALSILDISDGVGISCIASGVQYSAIRAIKDLPSVEPEWNNHTVACLLADMFDDSCACNYNDIDEWLPRKCEVIDSCPNPVGVACWEQYLKHRRENR